MDGPMDRSVTPAQFRGARALLGWSCMDLAKVAGVSAAAVHRAEGRYPRPVEVGTAGAIRFALETAGVGFLVMEDGTVGVALSPR